MRSLRLIGLSTLVFIAACGTSPETEPEDADGDGFTVMEGDCDDNDAEATPETEWHIDGDGDGHGDATAVVQCERPTGGILDATDCDDADADIYPGAPEHCDGVDENCDLVADDGALDEATYFVDVDQDGYGDTAAPLSACSVPSGYSAVGGDCDDDAPLVHPGATEVCDASDVDEDCDGSADEADSSVTGTQALYADTDGDGYGDASSPVTTCAGAPDTASNSLDCNDLDAAISPEAVEVCDALDTDEDCDGDADDLDDTPAGQTQFYTDTDNDGYGSTGFAFLACDSDEATEGADCNNFNATVFPGALEVCDGNDQDCNGLIDDGVGSMWYRDQDSDTYGDAGDSVQACGQPSGYVAMAGDCADAVAEIHPTATEIVGDNRDFDCDGTEICWIDADNDHHRRFPLGTMSSPTGRCDDFPGVASNIEPADDCSDENPTLFTDTIITYPDADADSYGDALGSALEECTVTQGRSLTHDDCDDDLSSTHPSATELCDAADNDCDDAIDEGVTIQAYNDADSDGFGTGTAFAVCTVGAGLSTIGGDCDDAAAAVFPGATELCDALQNDCDAAGWTLADEEGVVSLEDESGVFHDITTAFTGVYTVLNGSEVHVCAGTYDVRLLFSAGVSASIIGTDVNDVVLDGGGMHRLIDMSMGAGDVVFQNITFTNGSYNAGDGAVAYVLNAGSLVFDTVILNNNNALGWSGGMFLYETVVDIIDSEILNNNSIEAGALGVVSSQVTLTNTLIDGNSANFGTAAVVLSGASATLSSSGCTWGDNAPNDVAVQNVSTYSYTTEDFDCTSSGCVTR